MHSKVEYLHVNDYFAFRDCITVIGKWSVGSDIIIGRHNVIIICDMWHDIVTCVIVMCQCTMCHHVGSDVIVTCAISNCVTVSWHGIMCHVMVCDIICHVRVDDSIMHYDIMCHIIVTSHSAIMY